MFYLTNLLFVLSMLILSILFRFVFQPYRNWKTQKKKNGGTDKIKVLTPKGQMGFEQYQQQNKDKKVDISLIVPAFNEELRMPVMLEKTLPYFEKQNLSYEILIVSDDSKDKTIEVALSYGKYNQKEIDLKVVQLETNRGKGGAVRYGILIAKGQYKLFLDADGATDINEFQKVFKQLQEIKIETQVEGNKHSYGVVAGSRNHLVQEVVTERKWYRNILMHISNFIVNVICGVKLKDTQCGFKLFTKDSADIIFNTLHLERWAFDVEIFMIANHFKFPVKEVPVNWKDVDGSKLNVIEASITMARDFLLVRILYTFGIWKYSDKILKLDE